MALITISSLSDHALFGPALMRWLMPTTMASTIELFQCNKPHWRSRPGIQALEPKIGQQHAELGVFEPCGKSGNNSYGAACLAGRHLPSHPNDDDGRKAKSESSICARSSASADPAIIGIGSFLRPPGENWAARDAIQRLALNRRRYGSSSGFRSILVRRER